MPAELRDGKLVEVSAEGEVVREMTPDEAVAALNQYETDLDNVQVEYKAGGEVRTATVKELREKAALADGGHEALRQAATSREEARTGMEMIEVMQRLSRSTAENLNLADIQAFCRLSGLSQEQTKDVLDNLQGVRSAAGNQMPAPSAGVQGLDPRVVGAIQSLHQTVEGLKSTVSEVHQTTKARGEAEAEQAVRDELQSRLTRDPILSKMIVEADGSSPQWGTPGSAARDLLEDAFEKVRSRVVFGQATLGPALLDAVVEGLRTRAKRFRQPGSPGNQAGTPAVGPAPGGGGPSTLPRRPMQRPSALSPDYDQYFSKRFAEKLQASEFGGGGGQVS